MSITLEQLERAVRGEATLLRGGKPYPVKLNATELKEWERAKRDGWIYESNRRQCPLEYSFAQWCELNEKPYVSIRKRGDYAEVKIDTIFADFKLSSEQCEQVSRIFIKYRKDGGKSHLYPFVGNTLSGTDRIPVKYSSTVAIELVEICGRQQ